MDLKQGMKAAFESERKHREGIKKRGLVRYVKGDGFYFKDGESSEYGPLEDDSTNTLFELVDTIYHMREKAWFTQQQLSDFLDLVQEHLGDPRSWPKG
jgi:hypothetical protein